MIRADDEDGLESETQVIEIRILWGDAPIRVTHIPLSRGFLVGEPRASGSAGNEGEPDFALDPSLLGAAQVPLVDPRAEGPVVVVPPRAQAVIARGEREIATMEDAVAEGWARRSVGHGECHEVPLSPDSRVVVTLPPRGAPQGYRDAAVGESQSAPVVIEIARVRGGKPPRRRVTIPAEDRWAAGAAAVLVFAMLGAGLADRPPIVFDDDDVSPDVVQYIQQKILAADAAEQIIHTDVDSFPDDPLPYVHGDHPIENWSYGAVVRSPTRTFRSLDEWSRDSFCEPLPWGDPIRGLRTTEFLMTSHDCTADVRASLGGESKGVAWLDEFTDTEGQSRAANPRILPLGLYEEATSGAAHSEPSKRAIPMVRVVLTTPKEGGVALASTPAIDARVRSLRACYELGLRWSPGLATTMEVDLSYAGDDVYRAESARVGDENQRAVTRCMAGALDNIEIPSAHRRPVCARIEASTRR